VYGDLDRPGLDSRFLNARLCKPGSLWTSIEVQTETASTNQVVADRARDGAAEGLVVCAEYQSSGRGRLGRTWSAPPRSALLFSVLLRPATVPAERWPLLGLLTPLVVADAVRTVGEIDARVKWPNDVLVEDRKLAGILLERIDTPDGPAAVVGIGLNVSLREAEKPHEAATSLALDGAASTDRVTVLAAILRSFESRYRAWVADGGDSAGLLPAYRELSATLGREVRAELPDGTALTGTAVDIDADGRLVLENPNGRTALAAGDVIHAAQQPATRSDESTPIEGSSW
jgi:BirA family transcriptional regulator, biotin operon repressor / biotin---[acetyl-CoA-carboxylase] ligase